MRKPLRRPLRIYAFDPTLGRRFGNHMTIHVPYEDLRRARAGTDRGDRLRRQQRPLLRAGRPRRPRGAAAGRAAPTEADPRFHQQMVYAVASKTIDHFSIALGRSVRWTRRRGRAARATRGRGRCASSPTPCRTPTRTTTPQRHALVFGYFAATASDAGANLPGQTVFTCLSHDIIAHETTHALVHDIRQLLHGADGPRHPGLPRGLRGHRGPLPALHVPGGARWTTSCAPAACSPSRSCRPAHGRGARIGQAARPASRRRGAAQRAGGPGAAVRRGDGDAGRAARALWASPRDPGVLDRPSSRTSAAPILVAAVFDAFFTVYCHRMADLLRIARVRRRAAARASSGVDLAGPPGRGGRQDRPAVRQHVHPRPRLLPAGGHHLRRLPARPDHRGHRPRRPTTTTATATSSSRHSGRGGSVPSDVSSYSESRSSGSPRAGAAGSRSCCEGLNFDVSAARRGQVQRERAHPEPRSAALRRPSWASSAGLPDPGLTFHPVHRVGPDGQLALQIVVELLQHGEAPLDRSARARRACVPGRHHPGPRRARGRCRYAIFKRLASATGWDAQREFWDEWPARRASRSRRRPHAPPFQADFALIHRGY